MGYIVAVHGTDRAALTGGEIVTLRQWFENGGEDG
jgi:hypothetical protein